MRIWIQEYHSVELCEKRGTSCKPLLCTPSTFLTCSMVSVSDACRRLEYWTRIHRVRCKDYWYTYYCDVLRTYLMWSWVSSRINRVFLIRDILVCLRLCELRMQCTEHQNRWKVTQTFQALTRWLFSHRFPFFLISLQYSTAVDLFQGLHVVCMLKRSSRWREGMAWW